MRSASGGGLQAPKRGLDDAPDQDLIVQPGLKRRSGKARVEAKTRIHVDLEDERRARFIDAEVDTRIAVKPEQVPAGQREARQCRRERRLLPLDAEAARRAVIGLAAGRPFGVVTGDQRLAFSEALE